MPAYPGFVFLYFRPIHIKTQLHIKKAYILCMGFEPGVAEL